MQTRSEQAQALRAHIEASGLSVSRWAREVALREPRTVRRWLSGESPIPQVVLERLVIPGGGQ